MFWLDPAASNGTGSIDIIGQLPAAYRGNATSSAVMFEPGKILQIGGGAKTNADDSADALKSAVIININGSTPVLTPAPDMKYRRHWANATVLPNGTVLVNGGARVNNEYTGVAFASEIWDPVTGNWTEVASESVPRLYHASSALLPDGRVFSGGGGNPGPALQHNAQFYTPRYLLNTDGSLATRPEIQWVQDVAGYASNITTVVGMNQAIARVTLVRTSSTTHSFNMDQRFIELGFSQSGQTLTIATPATSHIAPPGYYLLSVIDSNGVVSESSILKLGSYNEIPADTAVPYAEATFPAHESDISASFSDISGIASDAESEVNRVLVRIQRVGVSPSLFWSESGWSNTSTWLDASVENTADPDNFTWNLADVDLTVAADYRVLVRAFDSAGNHATANDNFKTVFTAAASP